MNSTPLPASEAARADRRIAPLLVGLVAAILLAGFAKNFYLRPWLGTRHLTALAYLHGVLMSAWLALFLMQVWLVARKRVPAHRRLGAWGALIAAVIVSVGLATIGAAAYRIYPGASPATLALVFVAFDGLSLLLFGVLVATAIRARRQPAIHRRLMLMAMVALLPPALGRLVAYLRHDHIESIVMVLMIAIVLVCVLIDLLRTRRLQRALLAPALAIVAVNAATYLAQVNT